MDEWKPAPHSRRHAVYCDRDGRRLFVEAMRWGVFDGAHRREYQGFVGGVRVGTWASLGEAQTGTIAAASVDRLC